MHRLHKVRTCTGCTSSHHCDSDKYVRICCAEGLMQRAQIIHFSLTILREHIVAGFWCATRSPQRERGARSAETSCLSLKTRRRREGLMQVCIATLSHNPAQAQAACMYAAIDAQQMRSPGGEQNYKRQARCDSQNPPQTHTHTYTKFQTDAMDNHHPGPATVRASAHGRESAESSADSRSPRDGGDAAQQQLTTVAGQRARCTHHGLGDVVDVCEAMVPRSSAGRSSRGCWLLSSRSQRPAPIWW